MLDELLIIGISGHRFLDDLTTIERAVDDVLDRIIAENAGAMFVLYSPLSPGADQISAAAALGKGIPLTVILPMELSEYFKDFNEDQQISFQSLYEKRKEEILLPAPNSKENAFLNVGKYLVNHCDVMVFMWNGRVERGEGGTGQIFSMAQIAGLPIAWIRANNAIPGKSEMLPNTLIQGSVAYLNWKGKDR